MQEEPTEVVVNEDANNIDGFLQLWDETLDIWQHGLLGIDIGKILISLLILSGFLLFRGLFSKYVLSHLQTWSKKSDTKLDDKVFNALVPPLKFIPVILGIFFSAKYAGLDEILNSFFTKFIRTLIIFFILFILLITSFICKLVY